MGKEGTLREAFGAWLARGGNRIGEVAIRRSDSWEGYVLTHWEETDRASLPLKHFSTPGDARLLAQLDDAGRYRPLKTAPNLRHGWLLELKTLDELYSALDFFYPAALGVGAAFADHRLPVVPLRETLDRQSGMYAVTRKISDAKADMVVEACCSSQGGCLKTILWELKPGHPFAGLPPEKFDPDRDQLAAEAGQNAFPLLCNEACNLLVAAIRKAVKKTE
jgi:sirohydrochlorin cobaltochelatase